MSDPISIPEHIQEQLNEIKATLHQQIEYQQEQKEVQQELLDLYKSLKGFLTVMNWFERLAVFIAKIAAAGAFVWAAIEITVKAVGKK